MNGIGYVSSSFDTVRGKIVSEWRREGSRIYLHVEIPQGVKANIVLGDKSSSFNCGVYNFSFESEFISKYAVAE